MCGECWNAAMGAPVALAMGRYAWVGYRDRLPAPFRRRPRADGGGEGTVDPGTDPETPAPPAIDAAAAPEGGGTAGEAPDPGGGPGGGDGDLVGAPG